MMGRRAIIMFTVLVTLGMVQATWAWESGLNSTSWSMGAELNVFVDEVPAGDLPPGITNDILKAAVAEALKEWNDAQQEFLGLKLIKDGVTKQNADIHISWEKNRSSWGTSNPKDDYDKNKNGFGKETARVQIEMGDGLTKDGITRVLKHEIGHAEGLGHSAQSPLMKKIWAEMTTSPRQELI